MRSHHTTSRAMALVGLCALTVVAVAACGTDDVSFGPTREASATVVATEGSPSDVAPVTTPLPSTTTVTAVVPAAGGGSGGSGSGGSDDATGCAPNIGTAAAAARDAARIPPPQPQGRWHAYNAGGTWCPGLSWIELDNGSVGGPIRPHQLLIYHAGRFQGTGIRCEARYGQYVLATTPDAITVRYTYLDLGNPEQQHSQGGVGKTDVTFRWNGSRIVMDGTLPYAFTEGRC
ncbi:LppP/LprE family lipoprotein [Williamsia sp. MIQD14]|uniref:LppP/LprE family lipoprotein n=1 Tax=Williamsia sp. MIQD14 TaxID=3425703 RepID=UPI003D9FD799